MAGGFRSALAPWIGGASSALSSGGFRGLLGFWIGGASNQAIVVPVVPVVVDVGGSAQSGGGEPRLPHGHPGKPSKRRYGKRIRSIEEGGPLDVLHEVSGLQVVIDPSTVLALDEEEMIMLLLAIHEHNKQ